MIATKLIRSFITNFKDNMNNHVLSNKLNELINNNFGCSDIIN